VPIVKVISQSRMKKVSVTTHTLAILISIMFCASVVFSQVKTPPPQPSPTPPPGPVDGAFRKPDDTPLTTFEEEIRAKREIKIAEKEHQDNLNRAKEISDIGKQLKEGFKDNATTIDRDCFKKIDRLEKLTKKVRSEAGGDDDEITITPKPTDLPSAIKQIADASETLAKDVENTPRRVVSASVIGNANVLLELIRLAKSFARPQQ